MRRIDHFGLFPRASRQTSQGEIGDMQRPLTLPEMQLYAAAGLHIRYNLFRYRQISAFIPNS
jgi:hypothetical protein